MYRKLLFALLFLLVTSSLMARKRSAVERLDTGNALLDSVVIALNRQVNMLTKQSIDKLEIYADIEAQSWCTKEGVASRWLSDLIPFYARKDKVVPAEGFVQISYQEPCDMLVSPLSVKAETRRHGKKMMQEAEKILLPIYAIHHMNRRVADRVYTLPFCNDGLDLYNFALRDTVLPPDSVFLKICFSPKKQHHTLVEGFALVNPSDLRTKELNIAGRTDFGLMHDTIAFGWQNGHHVLMRNRARIDYKYGKAEGHNAYQINYIYRQLACETEQKDEEHEDPEEYDLTDIYTPEKTLYEFYFADSTHTIRRKKTLFQQLPQRLVGTADIDAFGTDMRVYGPLNPASFGYDKFNGITLRERVRFSHLWRSGRSLMIRPEVGYSFGLKEFRYKFDAQWVYGPHKRAGLRLIAQNGNSGFSSKFRDVVNDRLDEYGERLKNNTKQTWEEGINFDDLNLKYYRRYEFKFEHSLELCNGLMLYAGASYNYRKPVHHGKRAWSELDQAADEIVKDSYIDMNPFIRLEWTPRQYYHYKNQQKLYLASRFPTFKLEVAQGIYGFFGSTSNYGRYEFDVTQTIPLGNVRSLSYHVGSGMFYKQKGEYFINYNYFSRSQYPDNWETRIGGVFSLLDDYWYSSSPGYMQSHLMYESPFMLLHKIRPIAKYVIKERIYLSQLWADGKNAYTEVGYGMGNNYLNVGVFTGFVGLQFMDVGVKFTIEIDQHL